MGDKLVSEYDQEIPQSQTADKQQSHNNHETQEDKQIKTVFINVLLKETANIYLGVGVCFITKN